MCCVCLDKLAEVEEQRSLVSGLNVFEIVEALRREAEEADGRFKTEGEVTADVHLD